MTIPLRTDAPLHARIILTRQDRVKVGNRSFVPEPVDLGYVLVGEDDPARCRFVSYAGLRHMLETALATVDYRAFR